MALKSKVTVASVKRKWEEKYAELNNKYEELCRAHMQLARQADMHRNAETEAESELQEARELATDRLVLCHKMQGIIEYLEMKLEDSNGNQN